MAERKLKRIVRYSNVSSDYMARRQLRKGIGFWQLWGAGVGAVITGMFSGWNEGLAQGGFGGMTIGTILMAIMYLFMTFSMAELSAALPNAGGFYAFTRSAFGPVGGFLCGFAGLVEYLLIYSVALFYLADLIHAYVPVIPEPLLWLAIIGIFSAINIYSTDWAMKINLAVTIVAVAMIVVLSVGVLLSGSFQPDLLFTISPDPQITGTSTFLPKGSLGILGTLPFAIWFYLAIEALPQTAEEATSTERELPQAMVVSMVTLLVLSGLILVLNTGIPVGETVNGAAALATSEQPFTDGLQTIFGREGALPQLLLIGSIISNFAGFPIIIYAFSRILFAMSRAGYFPQWISVTNERGIPDRGILVGGGLVFGITSFFVLVGGEESNAGLAILTTSIAAAVLTYILLMASYIQIKLNRSSLPRPYRSPVGLWGAFTGLSLAVIAFISCFTIESYRLSVYIVVALIAVATIYFFSVGRHQVVSEAPEEQLDLADDSLFFPH